MHSVCDEFSFKHSFLTVYSNALIIFFYFILFHSIENLKSMIG